MSALNFINGFFGAPWFFWAGLLCALGPLVIHLLNRRRYRVVQWAAMDFLREAVQRNRRIMQLRDMLLLALRTCAMLLLGLALAQARCTSTAEKFDGSRPLHAVLLVDNSLSMAYQGEQSLGEDILDRAKQRAREYIVRLPADSRVSVIPLCGSRPKLSADAYTKEDALEALNKIPVVDGSARVQHALNEARAACENGPDLERRVLLLSDQQASNWAGFKGAADVAGLPPVQVIDLSSPEYENTWISELRLPDGLADIETPTTLIVELRHKGRSPRQNLQVTLSVDGVEAASKMVSLEPDDGDAAREVTFEHVFSTYSPEPGQPAQAAVKVAITPDRLPADDERHLVVNVVAALPVVFVDQYGSGDEDPIKNRLGETRHLRKLLAPITTRGEAARQLVKIRHLKLEELNRDVLADARLVVLAGLADPGEAVSLLREYVRQGGQLILAAGGDFSADRWNEAAWLDGEGILPAPLKSDPLGALPEEAQETISPLILSFESLGAHDYFRLPDVTESELRDLYAEPFFFKAVAVDLAPATLAEIQRRELERLEAEFAFFIEAKSRREKFSAPGPAAPLPEELAEDERKLAELIPAWLTWRAAPETPAEDWPAEPAARAARLERLVEESLPKARARFADDAGTPFLVERKVGQGQVLFVASGLLSSWNTLPKTNTFLVFDRIMRRMIEATLPNRNFAPAEEIPVPVPLDERLVTVSLQRPGFEQEPELLDPGALSANVRGVRVPLPLVRGLYRITAFGDSSLAAERADSPTEAPAPDRPLWELPLTVSGPADESNLTSLTRRQFAERVGEANLVWVGPNEEISLAGAQIKGQNAWWYLVGALLFLLFVEMAIVSWPALSALKTGGQAA